MATYDTNNYTLGRGRVFFDRFTAGTTTGTGERFVGNAPSISLQFQTEQLEHYASTNGVAEQDMTIDTKSTRSGTLRTDNLSKENLALFFFGDEGVVTTSSATGATSSWSTVKKGRWYQLGVTSGTPSGVRKVSSVVVKKADASVTYTLGTDYEVDLDLGRINVLTTGTIVEAAGLQVTYNVAASTRTQIVSGTSSVYGALRYIADNPSGTNYDFFIPYVKISPNSDFGLIAESDLQALEFKLDVLKLGSYAALYVDGRAV